MHAIKHINIQIEDLICLDIGASKGGFTQVLLNCKAKKIFAVDVGSNQLHERLKRDNKVINFANSYEELFNFSKFKPKLMQ